MNLSPYIYICIFINCLSLRFKRNAFFVFFSRRLLNVLLTVLDNNTLERLVNLLTREVEDL